MYPVEVVISSSFIFSIFSGLICWCAGYRHGIVVQNRLSNRG